MNKHPRKPGNNVLHMPTKPRRGRNPAREFRRQSGGARGALPPPAGRDDPRTQEAMRLIEVFLAIEDASARAALIALAESLVTHDWLRRQQAALSATSTSSSPPDHGRPPPKRRGRHGIAQIVNEFVKALAPRSRAARGVMVKNRR